MGTATDLVRFGAKGTVIAGYHYDLNLLTVHGKSRYEGLFIWLRDGRKVKVSVPDGFLLCQAAAQLEWLTAGHIFAGYHEVVVTEGTRKKHREMESEETSVVANLNDDVRAPPRRCAAADHRQIQNRRNAQKVPAHHRVPTSHERTQSHRARRRRRRRM